MNGPMSITHGIDKVTSIVKKWTRLGSDIFGKFYNYKRKRAREVEKKEWKIQEKCNARSGAAWGKRNCAGRKRLK